MEGEGGAGGTEGDDDDSRGESELSDDTLALRTTSFYTSHEALLLPYEQALARLHQAVGVLIEVEQPVGGQRTVQHAHERTALQRDGLVAYRGRRLRILRPDSLQMMRCGMGD